MFLDKNLKVYFNEINPIPGNSSNNSLFPKMLEFVGRLSIKVKKMMCYKKECLFQEDKALMLLNFFVFQLKNLF